jgi:6-phosphogluconolactonase
MLLCGCTSTPVNGGHAPGPNGGDPGGPTEDPVAASTGDPDATPKAAVDASRVQDARVVPDAAGAHHPSMNVMVYVGSGDWAGVSGRIDAYRLDVDDGDLTLLGGAAIGRLNSYVALDPSKRLLYAADEAGLALHAFSVDAATGQLSFLNTVSASGGPVYLSVDATRGHVLTCFYNQGSAEVFARLPDGGLGQATDTDASGAESHSIVPSPSNTHVFVASKGDEHIAQYHFDSAGGTLTPNAVPAANLPGGPRHLTFHPTLPRVYVVHEIADAVTVFDYDEGTGRLAHRQTLARMPSAFAGAHSGADIHVAPSGRFVYASNRAGDDSSIVIYGVDAADGSLTLVGHERTLGRTPRTFTIDATGKWLIAANQDSHSLVIFRMDAQTGQLTHHAAHALSVTPYYVGAFALR